MQLGEYKGSIEVLLAIFPLIIHLRKAKLVDAVFFLLLEFYLSARTYVRVPHILKYLA